MYVRTFMVMVEYFQNTNWTLQFDTQPVLTVVYQMFKICNQLSVSMLVLVSTEGVSSVPSGAGRVQHSAV